MLCLTPPLIPSRWRNGFGECWYVVSEEGNMECGSTALVDSQPRAARPHLSPLDRRMGSSRVGMESLRVGNLECGCATSIYSQPRAAMPQLPILPRKAMPHLVYLDEGSHRVLGDTVRRIDCRTSLRYVRNDRDKFVCVNRWNLVPVVPGSLTQALPRPQGGLQLRRNACVLSIWNAYANRRTPDGLAWLRKQQRHRR